MGLYEARKSGASCGASPAHMPLVYAASRTLSGSSTSAPVAPGFAGQELENAALHDEVEALQQEREELIKAIVESTASARPR